MKEIVLSNSPSVALVDDEDYDRVVSLNVKWRHNVKCVVAYFIIERNTFTHLPLREHIILHRFILNLGKKDVYEVDHIDRNILNNCKSNLRICTPAQNCWNRYQPVGISGYKGVTWVDYRNQWVARITFNKKRVILGYFSDPKKAALAYNEAALKHHGEFAAPNVIA